MVDCGHCGAAKTEVHALSTVGTSRLWDIPSSFLVSQLYFPCCFNWIILEAAISVSLLFPNWQISTSVWFSHSCQTLLQRRLYFSGKWSDAPSVHLIRLKRWSRGRNIKGLSIWKGAVFVHQSSILFGFIIPGVAAHEPQPKHERRHKLKTMPVIYLRAQREYNQTGIFS